MLRPVIAVVGPTAAGKSELSLALARHARRRDQSTPTRCSSTRAWTSARPSSTMSERAGMPHHLLDIWPVTQAASVSEYQQLARQAIDDIRGRGRTPILVGGSGLYVRAAHRQPAVPRHRPRPAGPAGGGAQPRWARPRCTRGWPPWTRPRRRRSCRATAAGSSGRSRSSSCPGRPFSATLPGLRVGLPGDPDRRRAAAAGTGPADRRPRAPDVAARPRRRGPPAGARGLRDGRTASRALGYAQVLRFLAGEWSRGGRGRADDPGDAPIRPPAGVLVPPRSACHLAGGGARLRLGRLRRSEQ